MNELAQQIGMSFVFNIKFLTLLEKHIGQLEPKTRPACCYSVNAISLKQFVAKPVYNKS